MPSLWHRGQAVWSTPTGGLFTHGLNIGPDTGLAILTTILGSAFTTLITDTWPTTYISTFTYMSLGCPPTSLYLPFSWSDTVPHHNTHHGTSLHQSVPLYQNGILIWMSHSHCMIGMHQTNYKNYMSSYISCRPSSMCKLWVSVRPWLPSWPACTGLDMRNVTYSLGNTHTSIRTGDHSWYGLNDHLIQKLMSKYVYST